MSRPPYCPPFTPMASYYPEAVEQGSFSITPFMVTSDTIRENALNAHFREMVPGEYVKLSENGQIWMSDTPWERRTNRPVAAYAMGRILVAGLGIGMLLPPLLSRCTCVVVIEKSQSIIEMVAPRFKDPRLTVIQGDIMEWRPDRGERFDGIYFDIWPKVSTRNWEQMKYLHRAFARFKVREGWTLSWERDTIRRELRSS